MWKIIDNILTNDQFTDMPESPMSAPYPDALWRLDNQKLTTGLFVENELIGAFANAVNLTKITIPRSCKYIGEYTFRNTALTSVKIASDCTYFPTSFPDGCQVKFYQEV